MEAVEGSPNSRTVGCGEPAAWQMHCTRHWGLATATEAIAIAEAWPAAHLVDRQHQFESFLQSVCAVLTVRCDAGVDVREMSGNGGPSR
jgi:hypothetical protein